MMIGGSKKLIILFIKHIKDIFFSFFGNLVPLICYKKYNILIFFPSENITNELSGFALWIDMFPLDVDIFVSKHSCKSEKIFLNYEYN